MKKSVVLLVLIWYVHLPWVWAAPGQAAETLARAQAALSAQQYEEAIPAFQALLDQGYRDPGLYHNLGLAHYEAGRLGWAIFFFQRGLRHWPHQADLRANLSWARSQQADELAPAPEFFLKAWWQRLAGLTTATAWTVVGLLAWWAAAAGLAWWIWRTRRRGLALALGALALAAICWGLAATRVAMFNRQDTAVVVAPEVALRVAPADESEVAVAAIHDGLEVKIIDQIAGWYKLSLPDGRKGWAPARAVAVI